jgi:transposase
MVPQESGRGRLEARITEVLAPFGDQAGRLMTVPGISRTVAEVVLAEAGPDLQTFPGAGHLASWVGLCRANHESAGKRKGGPGRKGSRWLRSILVQAAWAASHAKGTYLQARYRRPGVVADEEAEGGERRPLKTRVWACGGRRRLPSTRP